MSAAARILTLCLVAASWSARASACLCEASDEAQNSARADLVVVGRAEEALLEARRMSLALNDVQQEMERQIALRFRVREIRKAPTDVALGSVLTVFEPFVCSPRIELGRDTILYAVRASRPGLWVTGFCSGTTALPRRAPERPCKHPSSVRSAIAKIDAVFTADVISGSLQPGSTPAKFQYRAFVRQAWKGVEPGKEIVVVAGEEDEQLIVGEAKRLFARRTPEAYITQDCSAPGPVHRTSEDTERLIAEWEALQPDSVAHGTAVPATELRATPSGALTEEIFDLDGVLPPKPAVDSRVHTDRVDAPTPPRLQRTPRGCVVSPTSRSGHAGSLSIILMMGALLRRRVRLDATRRRSQWWRDSGPLGPRE